MPERTRHGKQRFYLIALFTAVIFLVTALATGMMTLRRLDHQIDVLNTTANRQLLSYLPADLAGYRLELQYWQDEQLLQEQQSEQRFKDEGSLVTLNGRVQIAQNGKMVDGLSLYRQVEQQGHSRLEVFYNSTLVMEAELDTDLTLTQWGYAPKRLFEERCQSVLLQKIETEFKSTLYQSVKEFIGR